MIPGQTVRGVATDVTLVDLNREEEYFANCKLAVHIVKSYQDRSCVAISRGPEGDALFLQTHAFHQPWNLRWVPFKGSSIPESLLWQMLPGFVGSSKQTSQKLNFKRLWSEA